MSLSSYKRPEPIKDRDHVMTFGCYKGKTVGLLLDNKPSYLLWLVENTEFELDHILQDEAEEGVDDPYFI